MSVWETMEAMYFLTQSAMAIAVTGGVIGAFKQLKTSKQFALLKYIDSNRMRQARRFVIHEVPKKDGHIWWDRNSEMYDAEAEAYAAAVCDGYQILASVMIADKNCNKLPWINYSKYFRRTHGQSIVHTYDILDKYIQWRHANGEPYRYREYHDLVTDLRGYDLVTDLRGRRSTSSS